MKSTLLFLLLTFLLELSSSTLQYGYLEGRKSGQAIVSHLLVKTMAESEIHCVVQCLLNSLCAAISYDCHHNVSSSQIECSLIYADTSTVPYQYAADSSACYGHLVNRIPGALPYMTPPTVPATTPVTTESPTVCTERIESVTSPVMSTASPYNMSYVIDVANNFQQHCSVGYDVGIITLDKVYFYDNMLSLDGPPCDVQDVTSYFSGFSDLPDTSQWDCVMTVQRGLIDVYANGNVWRWVIGIQRLWHDAHYPKRFRDNVHYILAYTPIVLPTQPIWSVYMSKIASANLYFYDSDGKFYLYRLEAPQENIFHPNDTLTNHMGYLLNPWNHLPPHVVGVTLIGEEDYLAVTADHKFYYMDLDYSVITDVDVQIYDKGYIVFS